MTITTSTQPLLRRSPANRSLEPGHLTPKDLRGPRTEYDRLSDVLFRLPNTTTTVRINLLPLMIHFSLIPDQNHHKIMKTVAHRCPASSAYAAAIIHSPRRPRTPLCRLAPLLSVSSHCTRQDSSLHIMCSAFVSPRHPQPQLCRSSRIQH